ncbi:MAG: pyrroline-5-carboxylate reductase [Armatimonadetes bacterium CG_4_10_14_3_um_filter_66_18]|nr:pyrroline-5-carboxylate reductase [Armatimonadota bacterium]PIU90229.1 MAG: pyrroline-5-carboxylate reductase [Armatimonadetes bacterium CG06_land_8_20_14_3_00_66_21]PIW21111.1 MAG: pyrroline-5-carboxylate reductase [Armatimonadetes bacterium CG17_big_fil_post_rev_8_21_14_2_50_66_6]PIX46028.1 MAG: pyrroline-5-carboxylate reductase [Armatimonadetes bacterium CG_4_8_14_3_um_filter_66_20]PIY50334.1 MAG: pyrroline-5-carboxylate reductase [Armatimonadetes bacterium CG_4_10_14_3_um_filter_66_18]P
MLAEKKVALLGVGAMGSALVRGALNAGVLEPAAITATDVDTARLAAIRAELAINTAPTNAEAVRGADCVVLAVKPKDVAAALEAARPGLCRDQLLISIAAGVPLAALEAQAPENAPVVRVMPNTPALVSRGAAAFCRGTHATAEHAALTNELLSAVGLAVEVEEKLMDAVTGLSGSGPAYVYLFIEALSDAGVRNGIPRDLSTRLAAQTVLGAAEMVLATGKHPGELKDMVTSPGGTTIAGIHCLERSAVRGAMMDAVTAATQRSAELAKK